MTNAHGTFIWYELLTTDPDAATDFYGKVVGWQARAERAMQAILGMKKRDIAALERAAEGTGT